MSKHKYQLRLLNLIDEAPDWVVEVGMNAYPDYHRCLTQISDAYSIPIDRVCGVFSALSPQADYMGNLRSCITLCKGYKEGYKQTDLTVTTYKECRRKGWLILEGHHFYSVFRGLKVRNFWRCLCEPDHPEAVVIDGHMVNIMENRVRPMREVGNVSHKRYAEFSKVVRDVARYYRWLPLQVQAIAWFEWKRRNNSVFTRQIDMFGPYKSWNPFIDIQYIKPFETSTIEKRN